VTRVRVIAAMLFALVPSLADPQPLSDFSMRQPIVADGSKAFFRVELPDAVYDGAARADVGDLRVFNGDGDAVPFAFLPPRAPLAAARERRQLALFPLTVDTTRPDASDLSISVRREGGSASVDIRSRDGTPVSGTRVVAYLIDAGADEKPLVALTAVLDGEANVNARLRVDAGDDLVRWRTIVADAPLLRLEYNGRRIVRDRIEFAPLAARYLRVTWLTPSPPGLAAVFGEIGDRIVDPPRRTRRATGTMDAGNAGTVLFDVGAALPIDRVTLELAELNTLAPVTWEGRTSADEAWRPLGASIVYRLRQDAGEIASPPHRLASSPLRYIRVRVDPKAGGVGATPPILAAEWQAQQIVFAARGKPPFELGYGSRRVAPGALPIATLVPGYVAGRPLPDNVGVATVSAPPSVVNRAAMRAPLDIERWLLWGSLVAASLLLAYMALRLAQQMRGDAGDAAAAPPPDDRGS
jgi:hypothetical protein